MDGKTYYFTTVGHPFYFRTWYFCPVCRTFGTLPTDGATFIIFNCRNCKVELITRSIKNQN